MDQPRRILIIDDMEAIHRDLRRILISPVDDGPELDSLDAEIFGEHHGGRSETRTSPIFELDSAFQGEAGYRMAVEAFESMEPYTLAFVDVRMPPGWDGLQTMRRIMEDEPDVQLVICTAYSDYSWEDIFERCGSTDRLLILKKPFDPIEVRQIAYSLSQKWFAERCARLQMNLLEDMVESRTEQIRLTNEELRRARETAERANRAKSDFLANMSHELRTPMTAVLGYAELIAHGEGTGMTLEERRQALQIILDNGTSLLHLIDEILDLSKVEAGKLEVEALEVRPAAIAEETERLLRMRAAERGIDFSLTVESGVPAQITSDPVRIRQVLINLVGNAIKFTDEGSVALRVSPTERDGEPFIAFAVYDTGIGLDEEQLARLFKPFSQADSSTTRRYGGTGLGLSLSLRIAELLDGGLSVESEPGIGSCFTLRVPARNAWVAPGSQAERTTPEASAAPAARIGRPIRLDSRVLVVDDVATNRMLVSTILEKAGATVDTAENGERAVESVRLADQSERPYSVILMDMQMPVMDGGEATRVLRAQGYSRPIIAFTAFAMSGDAEICLEAGCDAYLSKPVDRTRMLRMIADFERKLRLADPAD